jgi:O-antigen ligase
MVRRRFLCALMLALTVAAILQYPAATYILAFGAVLLTFLFTSEKTLPRHIGVVIAIVVPLGIGYVAVHLDRATSVTDNYFSVTGKTNNARFRELIYRSATTRIKASPIIGSLFTGESTVAVPRAIVVRVGGRRVNELPPHSDVVELWMLGGIGAVGLMVGWLVATNIAVARYCRRARRSEDIVLARLLLMIVNGFFTVGLVNPVLDQMGNTLVLAAAILCLRLLILRSAPEEREWRGLDAPDFPGGAASLHRTRSVMQPVR